MRAMPFFFFCIISGRPVCISHFLSRMSRSSLDVVVMVHLMLVHFFAIWLPWRDLPCGFCPVFACFIFFAIWMFLACCMIVLVIVACLVWFLRFKVLSVALYLFLVVIIGCPRIYTACDARALPSLGIFSGAPTFGRECRYLQYLPAFRIPPEAIALSNRCGG